MDEHRHLGPWSTTYEVTDSAPAIAVLGVGAFEQHSHHLALDTDHILAERLSTDVAASLGAMLLPPLPYSSSLEHLGFAGTITLSPGTVMSLIRDIAESVGRFGVSYLVLLNCHGGNFILNPTAREWNTKGGYPRIVLVEGYSLPGFEREGEVHSGEDETSILLHVAPETVRLERAVDYLPDASRADLTHFGMKGLSEEGVWGRPTKASADRGRELHTRAVEAAVTKVRAVISRFEELEPPAAQR